MEKSEWSITYIEGSQVIFFKINGFSLLIDLVLHLTQDIIWKTDKNKRKHHKQESKEVSPFHKAARNRKDSMA